MWRMDITSTTLTQLPPTRLLASGSLAYLDESGRVTFIDRYPDDDMGFDEGSTCSICDGLGHGYPGGPPCPLEETGALEADLQDRMEAAAGVIPFDVAMAAGR